MVHNDDPPIEWPERSDKTVYLFLSLYLLLLAFFILLNTISQTRDERVAEAVESVKETFQDYSPPSREFLESAANPDSMIAAEAYLDDVRNVFSAQLENTKFQTKTNGTLLRALVPVSDLFLPDNEELTPVARPLMDAIATGLGSSRLGTRREVEVVIGTGDSLPATPALGQSLELRRASALARGLRTRGVDGKALAGGLRQGDSEIVQLTFYVRKLGAAGVTFESQVE
jgi:hypothetical protein